MVEDEAVVGIERTIAADVQDAIERSMRTDDRLSDLISDIVEKRVEQLVAKKYKTVLQNMRDLEAEVEALKRR